MAPWLNDDTFVGLLEDNVNQSVQSMALVSSSDKNPGITAEDLVKNWGIGLEASSQTVKSTTQRAVRSVGCPTLARRFRTNDR